MSDGLEFEEYGKTSDILLLSEKVRKDFTDKLGAEFQSRWNDESRRLEIRMEVRGQRWIDYESLLDSAVPDEYLEFVQREMVQSLIDFACGLGVKHGIRDMREERKELYKRLRRAYIEQYNNRTISDIHEVDALLEEANRTDDNVVHWS